MVDDGQLEISSINFIRGRSIRRAFIIVDDAQNLTARQAKTILSRLAEGSKVVFTGDPDQIDNRFVDSLTNGLVYSIERLKGESLVGHLTLRETQRSPLAELVAGKM